MKIHRAIAGSSLLAALVLTYPLVGLAAPAGEGGEPRITCDGPPGFQGRGPMPPPGGPPGRGPFMGGPGPFVHGGPEWGAPPPFLAGLKLTEDQQDKVFAIVYAAAPAMREHAKALRKAREALMDLNTSAQYDEGNARTLADAAAKADSQLTLLRVHTEHEIYALLTPEQRKELEDRRHAHGPRDHEGRPPA
jgi:periplasmic protein CpxP/Spy